MDKNKSSKIIAIIALIVAVIGLSLGFAAFSRVLTIKSSAEVTPDETEFANNVKFVTSDGEGSTVTGSNTGNATSEEATLVDNQISNIKAHFTKPGQSVTYSFKVKNESSYDAYLKSITFDNATSGTSAIKCTEKEGTTASLVEAACRGIKVTVTVGTDPKAVATNGSNDEIDEHKLAKNTDETVTVKIEYEVGSEVADGNFDVAIGDIKLNYSTQDN